MQSSDFNSEETATKSDQGQTQPWPPSKSAAARQVQGQAKKPNQQGQVRLAEVGD